MRKLENPADLLKTLTNFEICRKDPEKTAFSGFLPSFIAAVICLIIYMIIVYFRSGRSGSGSGSSGSGGGSGGGSSSDWD